MKIVVYGPERRVGALVGDQVVDLHRAYAKYLAEKQGEARAAAAAAAVVPADLQGLVESGARGLEGAQQALDYLASGAQDQTGLDGATIVRPLSATKLQPPVPGPGSRIACGGANFAKHSAGMRRNQGTEVTEQEVYDAARKDGQWGFWKISRPILGPDDTLTYPSRTKLLDYEGECAIIIGKRGRNVSGAKARELYWGVTLFVDWSIRDDRGVPRAMSYNLGKNFDGSTAIGPCIVVGELDPENVPVETKLNGEVRQSYSTSEMIFTFPEILEWLSRDFTFLPGDVLSGGTGSGTAMDSSKRDADGKIPPDRFVKPGDTLEVSSPGIGTLRNKVTAPAAVAV
ncbi:MAG TPA: fumarylacetoacetate hydrolase family protein [Chloroflexota bacterium]|jgi:acylpyruvate hydrolase